MNADGRNVRRVTDLTANYITPAWANDGQSLVVASDRDDPDWEIYMLDRNGSNLRRLTNNQFADRFPSWHP
ncbi:MAG: PD40 domain-containing protein [Anaerolineae bacterium]|nr:MAG: PD40 domain-containing protein [Anaerolineae bacterium]